MVAVNMADFESWLCKKLTDLDIDAEIYGSYITGILNEEDDADDKEEALQEVFGSLVEDAEDLSKQVLSKWKPFETSGGTEIEEKVTTIEDILAAHSAKVTQNSAERTTVGQTDSAMKRALLEKYSEVYEEIDEDNESNKTQTKSIAPVTLGLFQNVNVKAVTDAEKQKREKQKEESQKKKEKDKNDREKQKQKKDERKEKEKKRTQKKERSGR